VHDVDSAAEEDEPDIATGMPVIDTNGERIGDVEAVEIDEATGRITLLHVRRGFLFTTETRVPASMIRAVTDCIVLNATAEAVKKLERP
jgi:sporulation protein YlmC with PRC-barrel domain